MTMGEHIRTMNNKQLSSMIADLLFATPSSDDKELFKEKMEEVLGEEEE